MVDEIQLEHRLTQIEERLKAGFDRSEAQQKTISINIQTLSDHVGKQNHRVEVLEENFAAIETRPPGYISKPVADQLLKEHADLWSVWRFSRWFIPISIPLSVLVVEVLNHVGLFEAVFRRAG